MRITLFCLMFLLNASYVLAQQSQTTYYLIRHAEKMTNTDNPHLNPAGKKRTKVWAKFFKDKGLDQVYSTDYHRTQETAKPIAEANGLKVKLYEPLSIYTEDFKKNTKGKNILIVGHSNTIPHIVNQMIEDEIYEELDESVYNKLFMVTMKDGFTEHQMLKVN